MRKGLAFFILFPVLLLICGIYAMAEDITSIERLNSDKVTTGVKQETVGEDT